MVKTNKYKRSIPASVPIPKKVPPKKVALPWMDMKYEREQVTLESKTFGKIAVYKVGSDDWPDKALIMYCGPSDAYAH